MTTKISIAGGVLLIAMALAACGKKDPQAANAAAAPAAKASTSTARVVRVARVEPRTLAGGIEASGVLVSREEAAVAAEVTGFRVARVAADIGSYVKAGEPLVQLDDTLLRSQIDQQQALVAQA